MSKKVSKSLKRVVADAEIRGLSIEITHHTESTLTAQMAADTAGVLVDQIVKSIIFRDADTGEHVLFLTSGANKVDLEKAATLCKSRLEKADAASIREHTGFAIGGVSPLGHKNPIRTFFDPHLLKFDVIWAAAGTPNHNFDCDPKVLLDVLDANVGDFTG